jgi:hypothetical protein
MISRRRWRAMVERIRQAATFGGAVALMTACHVIPPAPTPTGAATCEDVCVRGRQLGCGYANPTPCGATCVEVCVDVVAGGDFSLDLECRARAASCDAAESCEVER